MSMLLSTLVLAALVLAACGGGATSTNVVESPPPITAEATETMPATDMPTEAATEEPGVPVTGDINPARLSNELDFMVVDQTGSQVGEVEDMILDLTNRNVAYVVVNADGRSVAVPWTSLTLQTGDTDAGGAVSTPSGDATIAPETTGEATGEAMEGTATTEPGAATSEATSEAGAGVGMTGEGVFVLQTDVSLLTGAPEFDMTTLPAMGQSADDWDADIRNFW